MLAATDGARRASAVSRPRHRAARRRFRRGRSCAPARGRADAAEERAARPAPHRRARQHLRLRGAASRAPVAAARGGSAHARRKARRAGQSDPRRCWRRRSRRAARRCATIGRPTATLGYFQHAFEVYDREGAALPTRALPRDDRADRAERTVDVLVCGVPGVSPAGLRQIISHRHVNKCKCVRE